MYALTIGEGNPIAIIIKNPSSFNESTIFKYVPLVHVAGPAFSAVTHSNLQSVDVDF